jgi:hypothetical protein
MLRDGLTGKGNVRTFTVTVAPFPDVRDTQRASADFAPMITQVRRQAFAK